ncbi:Two component regulator propeller [Dyadobacter sp. SG02]|uniref:two-component regulator propeller domain-containing protein n=1 Tax=Dyadobacter sp. SG02 TaxID=1855291 RepID=UPI0008C50EEA|nr:two-component regulator propeller domain-containing protein [Dyadobacter sp. SG02]SEI81219.1 Two component regulator propeller [Dyadobacter sp. SG02]
MKRLIPILFFAFLMNACTSGDSPVPLEITDARLKDYHIISIAFDKSGTAWLGTLSQGLIRHSGTSIAVFDSSNSTLKKAPIWDIEVDKKGNVWLGTDALIKYNGSKFTRYESGLYNLPRNAVRAVAIDGADNIWFSAGASRQGGLVKYDGERFTTFTPENSQLPGNLVAGIAIDQNNTVWAALNDGVTATSMVRIKNDQWDVFSEKELGFSPYYYGNIVTNKDNELVASINYGLSSSITPGRPQIFRFNGQSSQVINLPEDDKKVYMTQTVFVDRDNRIWAAFWCDKEYGVFRNGQWELKDLDESGGVFAFGQSPTGEIWLGGGKGIYILK